MDTESPNQFYLSQARMRASLATLAAVATVTVPLVGWLGTRYIENVDSVVGVVGKLTTELAVLNTQVEHLRGDLKGLKTAVHDLQMQRPLVSPVEDTRTVVTRILPDD